MQGIPARLASGYAAEPGWGVRGRSEYSLPQNAAHAWVEVPFVGFGWVAFDPTGPDSSRRNTQAAEQTRREAAEQEDTSGPARHGREPGLTDRLSHLWRTQIVGFDAGRQRQMYRRWGQGLQGLLKMPDPSGLRWLIVPAAVVILGLVVLRLLGRLRMPRFGRRARAGQTPAQRAAQRFYQEMIRILARRGYVRRSSQTPAAFAETIRRGGFAESDAVQRLTQLFERARYGGDEPNADEQGEIIDLLTRLRHSAKGKKGIQAREGLRKDATVTAK
jgi:hypothetical protein